MVGAEPGLSGADSPLPAGNSFIMSLAGPLALALGAAEPAEPAEAAVARPEATCESSAGLLAGFGASGALLASSVGSWDEPTSARLRSEAEAGREAGLYSLAWNFSTLPASR